ncbi:MAG: antitoxin VapB family protein [Candidatus Bathyarchaeia archaeon]|nr:antitoxin VapB family protein [Candidatus Bathyarchaeota archaeon]
MTQTIANKDDVYKKLLIVKREGESFSDLFRRLIENISPLETLKKLRGCFKFRDRETLLNEINAARAKCRL